MVVVVAFTVAVEVATVFQCVPVQAIWIVEMQSTARCI